MRVKICGVKSSDDLKTATEAGADAVGFLVGQLHASPDFILPSTAQRLACELLPYVTPVIVTHLIDAESIFDILKKTGVYNVQLHGCSSLAEVKKLKKLMPPTGKIILAAHFVYDSIDISPDEYHPYINSILLDSYNKSAGQNGGAGRNHNWDRASQFVKLSTVPVILAGGLDDANVAAAISEVRPYGVDANSGLKGENGYHSVEKCKSFVEHARNACMSSEKPD